MVSVWMSLWATEPTWAAIVWTTPSRGATSSATQASWYAVRAPTTAAVPTFVGSLSDAAEISSGPTLRNDPVTRCRHLVRVLALTPATRSGRSVESLCGRPTSVTHEDEQADHERPRREQQD